ncbi:MAG: hypothetical protein LBC13_00345 [Clostridiales bacterium]|nr:hypothetical protein [Clostridiales bacterium]
MPSGKRSILVRAAISLKAISNGGAKIKIRKSGEATFVPFDNLPVKTNGILAEFYAESI